MLVVVVDPHMRTNSRSEKVAPGPAAGAASAVGAEVGGMDTDSELLHIYMKLHP